MSMNDTDIDIERRPMPLDQQKQNYEAITVVNTARQKWHLRKKDGVAEDEAIVNALWNAGWRPQDADRQDRRTLARALGDIAQRAKQALDETC